MNCPHLRSELFVTHRLNEQKNHGPDVLVCREMRSEFSDRALAHYTSVEVGGSHVLVFLRSRHVSGDDS
jgi:hypothetical protein